MKVKNLAAKTFAAVAILLGSITIPAQAQTKQVFAHYMVTNQDYGTGVTGYMTEIQQAQAAGIDGWALNCGGWSAQTYYQTYTANIFQAAHNLGTGFKLFFSADLCCGLSQSDIINMMQTYGNDSNYFKYNNRPVLTSFAGQAQGQSFWQGVLNSIRGGGMNVMFVPCFFPPVSDTETPTQSEVQTQWNSWWGSVSDGLFYWGVAGVPKSGYSPNQIPSSEGYANVAHGAGKVYMAPIPPHFWALTDTGGGRRYYEYGGGEGIRNLWMDAINTTHPEWVEIPTWNDFNEGTYMSPIDDPNAHPGNYLFKTEQGFYLNHQGTYDLMKYYIQWYKNGSQPALSQDTIYWFYRTAPAGLTCSDSAVTQRNGPIGDTIYVTCNLQSAATLRVTSGGVVTNVSVPAGSTDVEVPFHAGAQNFQLIRNSTVINANGHAINSSISEYNFLYSSGDASGSTGGTTGGTTGSTTGGTESPYGGTAAAIPGTVQAENYDNGGEGLAYHAAEAANRGGQYRTADVVDVETCSDTGGGYDEGWNATGELQKYTVNVATAGTYNVALRVANGTTANGTLHLGTPSGTNLSGTITIAPTGGWQTWATVNATVNLPSGQQIIEVYDDGSNYNLNYMTFTKASSGESPYGGTAAAIPGTVQIENYDNGGEGVAYHDTEAANQGGQYRTADGVDVEACTDTGGGYNVGWTNGGEWMKYTVNVATAGTYTVTFRVANGATANGTFHLSNASGATLCSGTVAPTGGWQTWANVTANVTLPAGQQILTFNEDSANFNINYMSFASSGGGAPGTPQNLTASAGNTQVALSWGSVSGATSYNIYRGTSSNGEGTTVFATSTTNSYTNTGLTNGTTYYYKVAAVNASGSSGQSNEASGTPSGLSNGIDLTVTSISLSPASPTSGSHVVFSCVVHNNGNTATPAGTIIGVQFAVDGVTTPINWSDNDTTSLGPGASVTLTATGGTNGVNYWTATSGSHSVQAWVDDVNRIAENNENNNKLSMNFSVP